MLAQFIEEHTDTIIERWCRMVADRISIEEASRPQLINSLPEFLEQLVRALRGQAGEGQFAEAQHYARFHGEHRLELGVDIEGLAQEFSLVGETIADLLCEAGLDPQPEELRDLWRLISYGTSSSVARYVELRDQQLGRQAARQHAFLAHEIRNSLNSAKLMTMVLQRRGADGEDGALLTRLSSALDDAARRVDDTLLSARLVEQPTPAYERCDLDQRVAHGIEIMKPAAEDKRVRLSITVEPDLTLEADPRLLDSVLVNLLSNGIRYSEEGGEVHLRARREGDQAVIEVEDSCGGMPEDLPAKLFTAYAQGEGDRSGFGLGLSIVRQAVNAHGGDVTVADRPGVGCRFTVTLPMDAQRANV